MQTFTDATRPTVELSRNILGLGWKWGQDNIKIITAGGLAAIVLLSIIFVVVDILMFKSRNLKKLGIAADGRSTARRQQAVRALRKIRADDNSVYQSMRRRLTGKKAI